MKWLLVLLVLAPSIAYAAETVSVSESDYLIFLNGPIKIMDVTDPGMPLAASNIPGTWNEFALTYDGKHVVAHSNDGLHIIDITDPYHPATISVFPAPSGIPHTISMDGIPHVVVAGDGEITLFDISDPHAPQALPPTSYGYAVRSLGQNDIVDVESLDDWILVATSGAVQIVDYGNFDHTVILPDRFGFGDVGPLVDVEIMRETGADFALVAGQQGMMTVNLNDPRHPLQSSIIRIDNIKDVAVSGGYAAVIHGDTVSVLNVTNPTDPVFLYSMDIVYDLDELAVMTSGDRMWVLAAGETVLALDITDPSGVVPGYSGHVQTPYAPSIVETVTIDGRLYALIGSDTDNSIQIFEITGAGAEPVSRIAGNLYGYGQFYGISDVTVVEIDGITYMLATHTNSNTLSMLDITMPQNPRLVSTIHDVATVFTPMSVDTFDLGGSTYAALSNYYANGIQLIDITVPYNPEPIVFISDDNYGFDGLLGSFDIDTMSVDGSAYVVATGYYDSAVQIIDVSDPLWPLPAASLSADTYKIGGPHTAATADIGEGTFVIVASVLDDAISIFDVSDPTAPLLASQLVDGAGGIEYMKSPKDLDILHMDDTSYVLVTSYFDGSLNIINITDPYAPIFESDLLLGSSSGPRQVSAILHEGSAYAVVAAFSGDSVYVVDVTDVQDPFIVSNVEGGFNSVVQLIGPHGIDSATISGRTYTLSAAYTEDTVRVTDITNPSSPSHVYTMRDGRDGFVMDGPIGILMDGSHVVIVGYWSNTLQLVNMEDPTSPVPIHTFRDGNDGFEIGGAVDVATVHMDGVTYAAVASGNMVQIIDLGDTTGPVATIRDGVDGIDLDVPQGVEIVHVGDRVYLLVSSFLAHNVQIIDMTAPSDPKPVSVIRGGQGYEHLHYLTDIDSIQVGDRIILAVSSYQSDSVTMVDITDPHRPYQISVASSENGFFIRAAESISTFNTESGSFIAVASSGDSVQLVDITNPDNPVRAGLIGSGLISSTYGVSDVGIIQYNGRSYMTILTLDEDVSLIVDVTDPYVPETLSAIPSVPAHTP